jgi:putative tricarboxylic transport membrane protein
MLAALAACGDDGGSSSDASSNGEDYPSGPIDVIAPADPGSGFDTTARAVSETLEQEELIDVPLPVTNRSGGLGVAALHAMVEQMEGDDSAIQIGSLNFNHSAATGAIKYDTEDVTMLAQLMVEHFAVVAAPDAAYDDLDGLFAAMEDAEDLAIGAQVEDAMAFGLLAQEAGLDPSAINFIAYEGGGEQTTALLNGDVQAALGGYGEFKPLLDAGELKGLAVLAEEPVEGVDLQTSVEQGYDVTIGNWRGVYGPPGMPEYAVDFWTETLEKMVATPTWDQIAERNLWTTEFRTGQELADYLAETQEAVDQGVEALEQ